MRKRMVFAKCIFEFYEPVGRGFEPLRARQKNSHRMVAVFLHTRREFEPGSVVNQAPVGPESRTLSERERVFEPLQTPSKSNASNLFILLINYQFIDKTAYNC